MNSAEIYPLKPLSHTKMSDNLQTIAIFAKPPLPGKTKTRIAAIMGDDFAVNLSRAMLLDVIDEAKKVENSNIVIFCPPDADFSSFKFCGIDAIVKQHGKDLGERMSNAFTRMFDEGVRKAIILGSDCVTISKSDIADTLFSLNKNDAVFKPAKDGGYMLVALNKRQPMLFDNIQWGTSSVMRETIKKLRVAQIDYELLSYGFDIDEVEDLEDLKEFLKRNTRPHTEEALRK